MAKSTRLTPLAIERAKPRAADWWMSDDEGTRGGGRLVVRIGTSGSKLFYFRYSIDGQRRQMPMRPYSSTPTEGRLTLDQARALARSYSDLHRRPESRDVMAHLQAQHDATAAAQRAADEAARAAEVERERAGKYSLKALCDEYITHQKSLGKYSAGDSEHLFRKYVHPTEFAALPARDLTAKQATAIVRAVVEAGHKTSAQKLRAYLRAAYALAQGAETNPQAPAALVLFGVESNPVASTAPIKDASRAREVKLTEEELGETVRLLRARRAAAFDDALAALELGLWLGGQRPKQVLRLTAADVDLDARTVMLFDPKGRRSAPRKHVLPLTDQAQEMIEQLLARRRAAWLFGEKDSPTNPNTVSRKAVELLAEVQGNVARQYEERGKKAPERPKIEGRDLRRTAETMLAGLGVSKDDRAQLLSHGLGGVQGRHYDMHEYMEEKRRALQAWADRLSSLAEREPAPSNVVAMPRRA